CAVLVPVACHPDAAAAAATEGSTVAFRPHSLFNHQEPWCSGTWLISASDASSTRAETKKMPACTMPGLLEVARMAVAIVTMAMVPICIDMDRSAARVEERSGSSCSPALRVAGLMVPLPAPTRNAEQASHTYGETPPAGLSASRIRPAMITAPPT